MPMPIQAVDLFALHDPQPRYDRARNSLVLTVLRRSRQRSPRSIRRKWQKLDF